MQLAAAALGLMQSSTGRIGRAKRDGRDIQFYLDKKFRRKRARFARRRNR